MKNNFPFPAFYSPMLSYQQGEKPALLVFIMEYVETKLDPPESFQFPFKPYDIQVDFMQNLYEAIEGKKLAIFESPTGTGKSMSLICGSLAWLRDHESRIKSDINKNITLIKEKINQLSTDDNWLEAHEKKAKEKQKRDRLQDRLNKIMKKEQKLEQIREEAKKLNELTRRKNIKDLKAPKLNKENEYKNNSHWLGTNEENSFIEEDILLDEFNDDFNKTISSDSESESDNEEEYSGVKIYFCSRTHSQLSQLVHEIQKSPYKDLNISVVSLSSRQNYCINDSVLKLKHLPLINERCQDMHNKKNEKVMKISEEGERLKRQKVTSGCTFYQQSHLESMKLKILTEIKDIEDVVQLGKEFHGCPYYASRAAVPDAKIILVPYNTILHKNTRTACGIHLKDSVVIIDEAHNLLDTIANIHSSLVSGYQLLCAHSQLMQYRDKFREKFSPYNLLYINQLIYIIKSLVLKLGGKVNVNPDFVIAEDNKVTLETLGDFALSCEIDNINIHEILQFAKRSHITHKLHGYALRYKPTVVVHKKVEEVKNGVASFLKSFGQKKEEKINEEAAEDVNCIEGNPLLAVLGFLESLTNHYDDGRIVCSKAKTIRESYIKFLLLNPATHFTDVVKEARAVILAGGTMQPISEFTDQLFLMAGGTADRISTFVCGHVIEEDNILPIIVTSGPTGKEFDFSYQQRNDPVLSQELGRLLINVCNVVPAGVVCFFPSYEYENYIYQQFQKLNIINKIENKKKVLREPKKSNQVDEVLKEYSKSAKKGALLFSVVGGKLSEGLNFNDDLGRCVLVIGLPYPNMLNPELKEKMNYLNMNVKANSGKEYYENLCMKAVNQSIGRSVRHKNDYASVLLVDHRYTRNQCQNALPKWIQKSLKIETNFGSVIKSLAKFFNCKKAAF